MNQTNKISDQKSSIRKPVKLSKVRATKKTSNIKNHKKKLALLLPGHNEELIIQTTIRSAVAAGQNINDIYVVDDASTDATRKKAVDLLGKKQVLTVKRSGKAKAVNTAIKHFAIEDRYRWLHVADADSIFGPNYFKIFRKHLVGNKYVVAIGFVQSLRGNWISNYRAFSYTYSQQLLRRAQSWLGVISVLPGPVTCFRTDIISEIEFNVDTITEDFDITLQIHRKHLGKICFIPEAINYTQDPQTLRDFRIQTQRWYRGFFQCITKHRIGTKPQGIDIFISAQLLQSLLYVLEMLILFPIVAIVTGDWMLFAYVFIIDFFIVSLMAIFSSTVAKRMSIMGALPYYYFLRYFELGIFLSAFVEIVVLKRFRTKIMPWSTEGRRYALTTTALKDVAQ